MILINEHHEFFLFCHEDQGPAVTADRGPRRYWVSPGGGVEPGETWKDSARRELWKETGIEGVPLGPWVWSHTQDGVLFGEPVRSSERHYLVRVHDATISPANQLPYEREVYQHHHWWPLAEIEVSDEIFFPERLAGLLAPLLAGELPMLPIALNTGWRTWPVGTTMDCLTSSQQA